MSRTGAFIISLDFELHWGIFDHTPLDANSRAYFDRTRRLIPTTLELFEQHGVSATWATVGLLFARNRQELEDLIPRQLPSYDDQQFSPYRLLDTVGEDENDDPYHYAPSLIGQIAQVEGQMIGSHTFSHYFCLERGQNIEEFRADLAAVQTAAKRTGIPPITSLVFPRNQFRPDYSTALLENGFSIFRGNPRSWYWRVRSARETTLAQRAVRLVDNYLPIGNDTTFMAHDKNNKLSNIPASRFFRPYLPKIDGFGGQRLKVRRILAEMTEAARDGLIYHLWWHPHNLATDPDRNIKALTQIVQHYTHLKQQYAWPSHSMESHHQWNRRTE